MGLRGPPPKPTAIRLMEGNPGKLPINHNEPQPVQELYPEPLDWMTEGGKKIWDYMAPKLVPLALLSVIDKNAFARYCELTAQWIEAKNVLQALGTQVYQVHHFVEQLDENGRPVLNPDGTKRLVRKLKFMAPVPQMSIMRNLSVELRKLENEFGLTPASRTRISVEAKTINNKTGVQPPRNKFKYNSR